MRVIHLVDRQDSITVADNIGEINWNKPNFKVITAFFLFLFGSISNASVTEVFSGQARFTSTQLANGLDVSIYEDQRMPIVTVQLVYYIGSSHEDANSRGLGHLFEHLMLGPTTNHPERAVFKIVELHGGSTNAVITFDETRYFASTPPGPHIKVLEIYADRMVNLQVTEESLAREKKVVLEELRVSAQNDPINRLGFEMLREGLDEHPYAISPLGTEEDVNGTTVAMCLAFYQRYYGPRNAHLSIAGPIDSDETFQVINQLFGSIDKKVESPRSVPALSDWDFPDELELSEDIPPVEASALIFKMPSVTSDDYEASNLMITLMSGIDGFEDELVRKRRKALYAQMFDLPTKAGRILAFGSIALPYRRKETAFSHLDQTLDKLSQFEWLNEQTLHATKQLYLQTEFQGRYRSSSMASRIEFAHGWRNDTLEAFNKEDRIEAVELDDIKQVYLRYIANAKATRIYVKPTRVPWYVSAFGWLYPLADRVGLTRFVL